MLRGYVGVMPRRTRRRTVGTAEVISCTSVGIGCTAIVINNSISACGGTRSEIGWDCTCDLLIIEGMLCGDRNCNVTYRDEALESP